MTLRPMTEAERRRFEADLPPELPWWGLGRDFAIGLAGAGLYGIAAALGVRFVLWLHDALSRDIQILWSVRLGWAVGLGVLVWLAWALVRLRLREQRRRAVLLADLADGRIEEERAEVTALHRLREPEHFTELLLLETADGRVWAIWDESTTDTEGGKGHRSTLRLGREMRVLRFPASGRSVASFRGAPLRRPKARDSDPRTWPDDDGWLTPAEAEALLRAA